MTVNVANVSLTNTFDFLRQQTNQLADIASTKAVTVGSNAAVGNTSVQGTIAANAMAANSIGGVATINANGTVAAAAVLYFSTNTTFLANLTVNNAIVQTVNSTANATMRPGQFNLGNSTVNASFTSATWTMANSTYSITFTPFSMAMGNSTVNATSNSTGVLVQNSTSTATFDVTKVHVGNSTVNAVMHANGTFSGIWNGTAIAITKGGTGLTSAPSQGQILAGNSTSGYSLTTIAGVNSSVVVTTNANGHIQLGANVVTAFNTRVGAVSLTQSDVISALGYTPSGTTINQWGSEGQEVYYTVGNVAIGFTPAVVGTGASFTATANATGNVDSISIVSGGTGYVNGHYLKITHASGSGATANLTTNTTGGITAVNIITAGGGYTSNPTVTVAGVSSNAALHIQTAGGNNLLFAESTTASQQNSNVVYKTANNTGNVTVIFSRANNTAPGKIVYEHSSNKMHMGVNAGINFTIDGSKVGIGNTSPSPNDGGEGWHVTGTNPGITLNTSSFDWKIGINPSTDFHGGRFSGGFGFYNPTADAGLFFSNGSANTSAFQVLTGNVINMKMVSNGNFAVGGAEPTAARMQVNGTVNATAFIGSWTGDTIAISRGGTGLSSAPTQGQILVGNSTGGWIATTMASGAGITITNNATGTITLNNAGVLSIANGDAQVVVGNTGGAYTISLAGSVALTTGATFTGNISAPSIFATNNVYLRHATQPLINLGNNTVDGLVKLYYQSSSNAVIIRIANSTGGDTGAKSLVANGTGFLTWDGQSVWTAGNDGAGSGLDADLLDGQNGTYYTDITARLGYTPANKAGDTFTGQVNVTSLVASEYLNIAKASGATVLYMGNTTVTRMQLYHDPSSNSGYLYLANTLGGATGQLFLQASFSDRTLYWDSQKVWTAGNDGAGTGLDADTLDGQQGSYYADIPSRLGYTPANKAGENFTGAINATSIQVISATQPTYFLGNTTNSRARLFYDYASNGMFLFVANPSGGSSGAKSFVTYGNGHIQWDGFTVWHAGNDGSGSGLDADHVRGTVPGARGLAALAGTSNSAVRGAINATSWKGQWLSSTTYFPGDFINYNGTTFVAVYCAVTTNTNKNPPTNAADWNLVISVPTSTGASGGGESGGIGGGEGGG